MVQTLLDETGQRAVHLLYDTYGGVLDINISDDLLATALADQDLQRLSGHALRLPPGHGD